MKSILMLKLKKKKRAKRTAVSDAVHNGDVDVNC